MAFDGIITSAIATELSNTITLGKIEKIYQPTGENLLIQIHTRKGNVKLLASCGSQSARICLTEDKYNNPMQPPNFCMLLRKHIQGGRITEVRQQGSERIIELDIEAQTELGFTTSKRLIVEIMGKHSNIILIDIESGKIIDAIKRISIDVNRYRQLLPGVIYVYPPEQNKTPFKLASSEDFTNSEGVTLSEKLIMNRISGISPAIARELLSADEPAARLKEIAESAETGSFTPLVYFDENDTPREFHIAELSECCELKREEFDSLSRCIEFYYQHRESTNIIKQKSVPLHKIVKSALDKALLKKKRLSEDLLRAENSDKYRLYGELLTANIHLIQSGARSVEVLNYYDGTSVTIPLSGKLSGAKNAQQYFKKYSKARTAVKEKAVQLEEVEADITYLDSVMQSLEAASTEVELDQIKEELVETGYIRYRSKPGQKRKKQKQAPLEYRLSDGHYVFVGRNNKENDQLTTKTASRSDIWFHTKDIPGSHVILVTETGEALKDISADTIYEAASIAAYHSKGKDSDNVPVDYTLVKYVKKPSGAKPGMVIFTHNSTVYVTPKLPGGDDNN
ncbi:Rqc2 family fibronectin-binding protein [Mogibacterium pumilum]|uniref:Rqc2 homolog RqcH n=1 Tax=Mogibacterium pumilum TaxID=86332 RepID=A0A223AU82_9FIRM|nr:NFACT RNA binding domain-containing protein [Mogibacterium pumilum]ASS38445.1 hypothetical protein AXF17_08605 [Mogibacterium pumilum]